MNAKDHLSNQYNKNINTKAKAKKYFRGIHFTLISVSTVCDIYVARTLPRTDGRLELAETFAVSKMKLSDAWVACHGKYISAAGHQSKGVWKCAMRSEINTDRLNVSRSNSFLDADTDWALFRNSLSFRIGVPLRVLFCDYYHNTGRPIFIHLQCWEVLPFLTFQHQRCMKILCPQHPQFIHRWRWIVKKGSASQHWRCIKISLPNTDTEFDGESISLATQKRMQILSQWELIPELFSMPRYKGGKLWELNVRPHWGALWLQACRVASLSVIVTDEICCNFSPVSASNISLI